MTPQLHREVIAPDEALSIKAMAQITAERMTPQNGRMRRGQHAKATGCVWAEFRVRDDLPENLRFGVFQPSRTYRAIVRFSNSPETLAKDSNPTARGIAVKLLDVEGTPAIPGTHPGCQDFLAVNAPVFPFATASEYLRFFQIRGMPMVGDLMAVAWLAMFHPSHMKIIQAIRAATIVSPLETRYWSGSPYWLGPADPDAPDGLAVKYILVPGEESVTPPPDPANLPDDYLNRALVQHLRDRDATFTFHVQPQLDPVKMPVEDPSVEWDETVSRPIPVATLTIRADQADPPAWRVPPEECEALAFFPWNALAEHRPMGGINRLRKAVYLASQARRAARGDSPSV